MNSTWERLSLAQRFGLAGGLVLLLGMAVIGVWVTRRIEDGVTRNTAIKAANYIDSVLAPLAQELARSETLSLGARRAVDELLSSGALGQDLVSFKIWKQGGLVVYSSHPSLVGARFEPTEHLNAAWAGQVVAGYDDLHDEEDELERAHGEPLLEIYSPIRLAWSGEVIGVAEFYERVTELEDNLARARAASWIVVATVTITMMSLLFGIVLRGSRTIEQQRAALTRRVDELSNLLEQNEKLRASLRGASGRAAELNERFLRRISAELHDGPTQLLALASLRLDRLESDAVTEASREELPLVREALAAALREIRMLSKGMAQPELANSDLGSVLRMVTSAHERRTESEVTLELPEKIPEVSLSARICVYRFAQEALNNAFRHGGGVDQRLSCVIEGSRLSVVVSDKGPGFAPERLNGAGLGLPGLRERIASLGGEFEIESTPGSGATLSMSLDLWAND